MAIKISDYPNKIDIGLKANSDFTRFLYRTKNDGKQYRTLFNYEDKNWDKKTRVSKAKSDARTFLERKKNPITEINEDIKLDDFIEEHFKYYPDTPWKKTKINHYRNYIAKSLGRKKVQTIKQMHIKQCLKAQKDLGLKPRTIKTTIEILNPVFKEAIANRLIDFNPCTGITIKVPKTKKIVIGASQQLFEIFNAIIDVFKDDSFYQSFYFFALQGRRKSEILKLRWENIDFENNTYLLEDTKNDEHQLYTLPTYIKELLLTFNNPTGYIYESPIIPGKPITNVEKQTKKLKKVIPNFTLHYMRNVVVSAMGEQGVSATLMSSALGHNNTSTLSKYLTLNHKKGSNEANKVIEAVIKKAKSSVQ